MFGRREGGRSNIPEPPVPDSSDRQNDEPRKMTKRGFLKGLGIGAAFAAGLGSLLESGSARAESTSVEGKRPSSEQVKQAALENLLRNESLQRQIGREGIEEFRKALEQWDETKVNEMIAEMAGVSVASLEKESILEITLLSDEQIEILGQKNKNLHKGANGATQNDKIWLRASVFLGSDKKVDHYKFLRTLVHERSHVATTSSEKTLGGEQERLWDRKGVPLELNEGITELMAMRILEKMGHATRDQSYSGGNFSAAYVLERLVGTENIAADFYRGTTENLEHALNTKLGLKAFHLIVRDHFIPLVKALAPQPEGLAILAETLRLSRQAGLESNSLFAAANGDTLRESMRVVDDGFGIVLTAELTGGIQNAHGVFEEKISLFPHSPPLRLYLLPVEKGPIFDEARVARVAKEYVEAGQKIEEIAEDITQLKKMEYMKNVDFDELSASAVKDTLKNKQGSSFNVVIVVGPELSALQEEYRCARSKQEKKNTEEKIAVEMARLGKNYLARIREESQKIKEKK